VTRAARVGILTSGGDSPGLNAAVRETRFETDARRLAGDAVVIAIAIRWWEVRDRAGLPSWPELVRRRSLAPRRTEAASPRPLVRMTAHRGPC
jgi:hypothetical protein